MYRYTDEDRKIIAEARKANKDKRAEKRLHALEMRALGKSAKEISAETGLKERYIPQLTAKYLAGVIEAISGNHYGGNRRNLTIKEEADILEPFREKAVKGQVVEISEIKARY